MSLTLSLRLRDRRVVVVGADAAAQPLVDRLCSAGADVLVVAAVLGPWLTERAARGAITARRRDYRPADLDGAWLVVAGADRESVNAAVESDAERRRIWCISAADADSASALLPDGPGDAAAPAGSMVDRAPAPARAGRRVLVLGGARSGKSATAEAMLADSALVDYVATGYRQGGGDEEWDARVLAHRQRRPDHWRTSETIDLERVLAEPASGTPALIDCLATWLAQVMDDCGIWADASAARVASTAADKLTRRVDGLAAAWQATARHVVAVSNEVGSGVVPATASGRRFRDELGWLNARIAAASEEVWLCTAGIARRLK